MDTLTFTNAPTHTVNGIQYLDDAAAVVLGDRIAAQYATLLERLADA